MIMASTPIRISRPIVPVMMKRVLILSWFGETPFCGVNVPANAGAAATIRTRAATATASRMTFLFERKAGGNYTVPAALTSRSGLGACEGCLALLDEGCDALAHVICAEELMLNLSLEFELSGQVPVEHPVERVLRAGVRLGRTARQPSSQLQRLLGERLRFDHAVDEAPLE